MAKFYGKLKGLITLLESKPILPLRKQKWNEIVCLLQGKEKCIPYWYYIIVSHEKINDLRSKPIGETIDYTKFGCVIQYKNDRNEIVSMSGWGTDPPRSLKLWFNKHYNDDSIDENTQCNYDCDDIRLCRIQRIVSNQLIGIKRFYNKQDDFHYFILSDKSDELSLAYRSGIKNFDRFICLNGINIEHETFNEITQRFNNQLNLPLQILVCSPATYHYYKTNNIHLHSHLPTVQHLKPVFDISLTKENPTISTNSILNEMFYVVQLETNNMIYIVSQSSIFKSPEFIHINDICFIEIENCYQRGQIKYKGLQDQCENFLKQLSNNTINEYTHDCISQDNLLLSQTKTLSNKIIPNNKSELEDLPNELLFDIFNYLTIEDFDNAFNNLNSRFNNLLLSIYNMLFIFDENPNFYLIKSYGFKIAHLIIDTSNECNLKEFSNLNSLILYNRDLNHIKQICPQILPNLVNLSFLLESDFQPPIQLINEIFSNKFPSLRYVNLGWIDRPYSNSWLISPSIKYVSIRCKNSMIISDILLSCPNLNHFQLNILCNSDRNNINLSSTFIHSLKRFTLWSDEIELSYDLIDNLLSYIPNIQRLYLQTKCQISFIDLAQNLIHRLHYLSHFSCFITELIMKNHRIDSLNNIHKISSCFNRIQCIEENENFRIFATD
ncbi:unnamed protein product [Adineta steineri]|uniref:F-box domain-containing protein n=1 Tax=Adineta steineri TaxID=433720 RepID=A0A818RM25_9BILA|nr:unnamed protein product [Adineta steineri]CAF3653238.1 unnamed protein product [Adineta steineri]